MRGARDTYPRDTMNASKPEGGRDYMAMTPLVRMSLTQQPIRVGTRWQLAKVVMLAEDAERKEFSPAIKMLGRRSSKTYILGG